MKYKRKIFFLLFIFLFGILKLTKDINLPKIFNYLAKENSKTSLVNNNRKVIYLTFDDGPSIITDKVLDILKENEVKATFFVIGNQINSLEYVVKRIHNEGHSIGLHTYTHKFKLIYSSKSIFIKEMLDCRNEINKVVGISPNIIRFPGGSRNHLNDAYLDKLHSYNFKIYDWNMVTLDGVNPKLSPYRLYRKATQGNEELSTIILLMHCDYMHKNTYLALPEIIKYYKEKGFEFKTITEDTPELYFPTTK